MDMMMKNLKKDMDFQWKSYYETRVSTHRIKNYIALYADLCYHRIVKSHKH